ncbi:MAG TPA: histidine kinase, partial [Chitinophagaceae bacterium]
LARSATYLVYDEDYKIRPIDFKGAVNNSLTAAENTKGNTWIGTFEGVMYTDQNFRVLAIDTTLAPSRQVSSMLIKNDSTALVGAVGLYEVTFSKGRLSKKKIIPELDNQRILTLYKDNLGKYWIGADNGLYRFTPHTGKLEWFDVSDNVQNKRFNPNSVFRTSAGFLFIGGFNGLNYFVPERITSRAEKLTVIISGVRIGQDDSSYVAANLPWELRHANSLEFQFTTPYFHNPQKVQYRYRLQGLDSSWVYNGRNNVVRFSALRPGSYTFRAAASLDGINWFEAKQAYPLTIMPEFWQTSWFVGLCLALAALITYLLLRMYAARMERREMQKMIDYFALSGHDHLTVDDILWDIARNCISRLDFEDCVIYMLDQERKVLVQKAAYGIKNPTEREIYNPIEIPVGKGIVGSVALNRKPELITDTSKDERYIVDDVRRFSELAVPIIYGEKVLGVIDSEHRRKNFFRKKHKDVLMSVASICSSKIAKVLAQQASLEKEKRMKELDLLMKESRLAVLQSQMNPHFIFNAMNSIQRFTLQHDVENANKYISRFSKLLRMVLQHSEKNAITLEDEIQMLQLYLEIESLRMSNAFTFRFEVDEDIETDALKIPGMMVQPFVENALAHGLANKPGEKTLVVRFYMPHDRLLLCEVTDNGIGREQAMIVKEKKAALMPHQSRGINLVQERLSLYNKKVTGKITILDLVDDLGEPAGTTVRIEIPVM